MARAPGTTNEIEISTDNANEKTKLPFTQRMKIRLTNFFRSLRIFLYNKETKAIFGNSSSFWIKTSIYYAIFYICLGLFYSGMIAVFGAIISRESPTYWYQSSEMSDGGTVYPGMGFRPMPAIDSTSLTRYNSTKAINDTVSSLDSYRIVFLTQYDATYLQDCSPTEPASKLQGSRSCRFSWSDIVVSETHPCAPGSMYGWAYGQPCVLVKLNKIYGWKPQSGGDIVSQVATAIGQPVDTVDQREENIYITCNGKTAADKGNIGALKYYSLLHPLGHANYGGIPYYFYPYMNSREHVEPFVLVQFLTLPMEQTVTVECRAWAPNIEQRSEGTTSRGMVTFSIQKTDKTGPPA